MWSGTVSVDANGIVFFDPFVVASWRPNIAIGADLFTEFITTEVGDEVTRGGIFLPILAIDDAGYDVFVRHSAERSAARGEIVVTNGEFPLHVKQGLVVADLAVLRHWDPGVDWQHIPVPAGTYAATIHGFRQVSSKPELVAAGYELVLDARSALPPVTGDQSRNMRVNNWWDSPGT